MSQPSDIELAPGHKFAVIAVSEARTGGPSAALVQLPRGYAVSSKLPAESLETWGTDIGRFHRQELDQTTMFLWAITPSETTEVLDNQDRELRRHAYRLFLGVLLAVPFFSAGRLTAMTGGNAGQAARVRSLTTYGRTHYTSGAPRPRLSLDKLNLAGRVAVAIRRHDNFGGRHRISRSLTAFRLGMEAWGIDERLHQFVRCAEGFAATPNKRSGFHFSRRLSRICAGRSRRCLEEMYLIRSSVEHLHGPFSRLPRRLNKNQALVRLQIRTIQAEALARYLLTRYFMDDALWRHFRDRDTATQFWELPRAEFRRAWPGQLGLAAVADNFDYDGFAAERESSDES